MKHLAQKSGLLLPLLLAATVLRAFVPVGYMPVAPDDGLLFAPCHDAVILDFGTASDSSHAHHHDSHDEGATAAGDTCSLGHILSVAFIDHHLSFDSLTLAPARFDSPEPASTFLPVTRIAHEPRGPPHA